MKSYPPAPTSTGAAMSWRTALKRVTGGGIAGVLALIFSSCAPGAPTPIVTATLSRPWTPTPTTPNDATKHPLIL
jgi:hypothetical protein